MKNGGVSMQAPEIGEVERVFFDAVTCGWAAGAAKIALPDMPGAKGIPYRDGGWYVLDHYRVTPYSNKSFGEIDIWYQEHLVWAMQFGGQYPERVIGFLKTALIQNYARRHFIGGRGPRVFSQGSLVYINTCAAECSFGHFEGEETIVDSGIEMTLGRHWYRGMSMIGA